MRAGKRLDVKGTMHHMYVQDIFGLFFVLFFFHNGLISRAHPKVADFGKLEASTRRSLSAPPFIDILCHFSLRFGKPVHYTFFCLFLTAR